MSRNTCVRVNYRGEEGGGCVEVQPIAIGVSFILSLQSQCHGSLFDGTWQKRPRELDDRVRLEKKELTLQMQ